MADELAGPLSYSAGWLWFVVGLTLLPFLIAAVRRLGPAVLRWARERRRALSDRQQCLATIADVESRHSAGTLSARQAHLELSRAVRHFVMIRSGDRIDTMTLADLTEAGNAVAGTAVSGAQTELIEAVRMFYDGAFAGQPTSGLGAAADSARRAVLACN